MFAWENTLFHSPVNDPMQWLPQTLTVAELNTEKKIKIKFHSLAYELNFKLSSSACEKIDLEK